MMSFVSIAILVLSAPITFIISPVTIFISLLSLTLDCNKIVNAHINSIQQLDAFQCSLNIYAPVYNTNITIPQIDCTDITRCKQLYHHNYNLFQNHTCSNITIAINHIYKENSCIQIIKSTSELNNVIEYNIVAAFFIKGIIELVILIIFIIYCCYFLKI